MVYPGMIPSKSIPGGNTPGGGGNGPNSHQHQNSSGTGVIGGGTGSTGGGGLGAQAASKVERVRPRIFGFQVHEHARLLRWQEKIRDQ